MKAITDDSFGAGVLLSDSPTVIKFEASWCQPCKAMQPALEEISQHDDLDGVEFVKADIEQTSQIAAQLGVRQVPTLVVVKNNSVVGIKFGATPKSQMLSWIKGVLA